MKTFLICGTFLLLSTQSFAAPAETELQIGKFSAGELAGWKEQTIWNSPKTSYSFVPKNGRNVLTAKSTNSASGLLHKLDLDPKSYPVIKWSWKIDHTLKKGNEKAKNGNDFAARLYVVFPRGFFSRMRAIEYVWGNVMTKGESARSPYSGNIVMIAVDAGEELAGQWISHKRNYYEDYRAAFGEEAPRVGAIAIMTDSDNTHENAVAYYGDISLLSSAREDEQKAKEYKNKEAAPKEQPHKDKHPKDVGPKELSNGVPAVAPTVPAPPVQNQL